MSVNPHTFQYCRYSVTSCNVPEYLVQSQFLSLTLLRCFQYFYYILKFLIPQDAITHLQSVLPAPPWKRHSRSNSAGTAHTLRTVRWISYTRSFS